MAKCECGCGGKTTVITKTITSQGRFKGQPNRFIAGHHNRLRVKNFLEGRDPERARAYQRAYHEQNRADAIARTRAWAEAHPEDVKAARRRRNARRRARVVNGFVEDVEALVVLEHDDGVCGICGEDVDPADFHVDHIVPLAAGGWHAYDNVQLAHPVCNQRKGAS